MTGTQVESPHLTAEENPIIEREKPLELSVQSCLESIGISLLSEWDVLRFVYCHAASLTSSDQIARFVGYERTVIGAALDRLEHEKLIERSRPSRGVHFYRVASTETGRWRSLQQLVSLSESRAGRLLVAKRLKPVRSEPDGKNNRLSPESEGKWSCPNAT